MLPLSSEYDAYQQALGCLRGQWVGTRPVLCSCMNHVHRLLPQVVISEFSRLGWSFFRASLIGPENPLQSCKMGDLLEFAGFQWAGGGLGCAAQNFQLCLGASM